MGAHTKAKLVHLLYFASTSPQVSVIALFHDHPDHQGICYRWQFLCGKLFDDRSVKILDVLVTAFSTSQHVLYGKLLQSISTAKRNMKSMLSYLHITDVN